jgi:hypothetical protein
LYTDLDTLRYLNVWLVHMVILFLAFWGTSILISYILAGLVYIPQQCTRYKRSSFPAPLILHTDHHLLFFVFLKIDIWNGVKLNNSVIFICIFLLAKDAVHFFMCLFSICTSSFENCPVHLPIYYIHFVFTFFSPLCILEINPLSSKGFLPFCKLSFHFHN